MALPVPTWDGWGDVFAAQDADIESHSPCLYQAKWEILDLLNWVPEMSGTGIVWNFCAPEVDGVAHLRVSTKINTDHRDLWTPIAEETTEWNQVNYPR